MYSNYSECFGFFFYIFIFCKIDFYFYENIIICMKIYFVYFDLV